jgi:hypothetical protein
MDEKDVQMLKEKLELIFEQKVTVDQAKKIVAFIKMFESMGADFTEDMNFATLMTSQMISVSPSLSPTASQGPSVPSSVSYHKGLRHQAIFPSTGGISNIKKGLLKHYLNRFVKSAK